MGKLDIYKDFCAFYSENFKNEEAYFEYYNNLKDKIIDRIKNSECFKVLNNEKLNISKVFELPEVVINLSLSEIVKVLPQKDVYKENNVGEYFISIDMQKANFSALVLFGKMSEQLIGEPVNDNIFNSFDYDAFMKEFTPYEYFAKSKYIRQVVFGNCNPKRQVTFEKFIMAGLIERFLLSGVLNSIDEVYSLCSDEIIIRTTKEGMQDKMNNIIKYIANHSDDETPSLRIEGFQLGRVKGTNAYIKNIITGPDKHIDLKCVNPIEAPFIYRTLKGEPVSLNDRMFLHEGKKAILVDIPEVEISYKK